MPSAPITGIDNIILAVHDMDRSLAFYRDAVGLEVRMTSPEFAFLQAGVVTLCLRRSAGAAEATATGTGVEVVFSVSDIHEAYAALTAKGVKFRVEPRVVTGTLWAADFRDPDGHVLSIFGPAPAGTQA